VRVLWETKLVPLLAITYFILDQTVNESVDVVFRKFWEIEVESLPVLSRNKKMVLEKGKDSMKFVDDHYQIAIPWKEVDCPYHTVLK